MATSFDKLEKLFCRSKLHAAPHHPLLHNKSSKLFSRNTSSPSPTPEPTLFPQPSFIRPSTSRMRARDDVALASSRTNRQSNSDSGDCNDQDSRQGDHSIDERQHAPSCKWLRRPALPTSVPDPQMAVTQRLTAALMESMADASGPGASSIIPSFIMSSSSSLSSLSTSSSPPKKAPAVPIIHLASPQNVSSRVDTPPPSSQDDKFSLFPKIAECRLPFLSAPGQLTPEVSPTVLTMPDLQSSATACYSGPSMNKTRHDQNPRIGQLKLLSTTTPVSPFFSRRTSDTTLSGPRPIMLDAVLLEPSIKDFMALSDDDVAETQPPSTSPYSGLLTPTTTEHQVLISPPMPARSHPLLTLTSPPLDSHLAIAAAFEVARMAAQHSFDLIYVINLWPISVPPIRWLSAVSLSRKSAGVARRTIRPSKSSSLLAMRSAGEPGMSASSMNGTSPQATSGCLLAASGLARVASPFRISAPAHSKILSSSEWMECRDGISLFGELAVGYACSFFADRSSVEDRAPPRSVSFNVNVNVSATNPFPPPGRSNNRGVVFGAFRLPDAHGHTRQSSPTELQALYRDAKSLIDMLVASPKSRTSRRRNQPKSTQTRPKRPNHPSTTAICAHNPPLSSLNPALAVST